MKNMLIISYLWPPSGAVGSIRPAKLAKSLSQQGWKTTIVTVKERYYEELNESSQERDWNVAGAVIRTKCLGNLRLLYVWMKARLFKLMGRESEFTASVLRGPVETQVGGTDSFLSASRRICLSLLYTPDEHQGWLPFAIPTCLRIIKRDSIDCVISTGPPFSSHLVGLAVKKLARIRWIAEFRDPWVGNEQRPSVLQSGLSSILNKKLEAAVIRNADRVVCVTPAMTDHYRKAYSRLGAEKWVTITNGFERQDFDALGPVARSPKFTISYLGSLVYARSPESLFYAVGELVKEEAISSGDLAIRFIGKCRYAEGRSVKEMAAEHGLKEIVEVIDFLPRCEALKEMLRAHVLLLLATQQTLQVPGKAYEYLAAGAKILAVTEEKGATADFIKGVGGWVASPDDYTSIKSIIKTWYGDYKREGLSSGTQDPAAPPAMERYEWGQLGRHYAEVLESCCGF
jgi:glycosyltransferase involved in cell wall biosynthesis